MPRFTRPGDGTAPMPADDTGVDADGDALRVRAADRDRRHARQRSVEAARADIFRAAMPTYVYKFVDTGETIEIQQAFHEDTLTEAVHPQSGETLPVKKVFQPVGVTFKGDGFYKTDSRASAKQADRASKSSDSKSSDSKSTDSKSSDSKSSDSSSSSSSSTSSSSGGDSSSSAPSKSPSSSAKSD
jgi:predicted nucleic acid-binding Zn ribbon protein